MAIRPETTVLDRLLDPLAEALTPDAAQRIVDLRASPEVQARIDELGDKCNEGQLSEAEAQEYDAYVHAINFISILQSKARHLLAETTST